MSEQNELSPEVIQVLRMTEEEFCQSLDPERRREYEWRRSETLAWKLHELNEAWNALMKAIHKDFTPLRVRKLIAKMVNPFFPGYGGCYRCGRNWRICTSHATMYTVEHGTFPLCQECWEELDIEQRLVYYRMLWNSWQSYASGESEHVDIHTGAISPVHFATREEGLEDLRLIEDAVRRGL